MGYGGRAVQKQKARANNTLKKPKKLDFPALGVFKKLYQKIYKRVKEKEKGTHQHHKGGCGRITGIRCGHALCWNLNEPRDNRCGKCKGKLPKWVGGTWLPKQAVFREREQDELWAVVSGTEYRGSPQGKRKWEEMGWGVARRF